MSSSDDVDKDVDADADGAYKDDELEEDPLANISLEQLQALACNVHCLFGSLPTQSWLKAPLVNSLLFGGSSSDRERVGLTEGTLSQLSFKETYNHGDETSTGGYLDPLLERASSSASVRLIRP